MSKIEDRLRRLESDAESFDAIAADNRSRKRQLKSDLESRTMTEDDERLLNEYDVEEAAASQDARDAEREMDKFRTELMHLRQRG